jgi:hypothetical protein
MRVSVLIVGSLFWDQSPVRTGWRQSRLLLNAACSVKTPIRYGRSSRSRGNTFTMTFDPRIPTGRGLLVPCKRPVASISQLIAEAQSLWAAESLRQHSKQIGASWGVVAALIHKQHLASQIASEWSRFFANAVVGNLPPSVDRMGQLRLPWPTGPFDALNEPDIILATSTIPDATTPSVTDIADRWIGQLLGYESYFFENVRYGLRTAQDVAIWRRMEEMNPPWLSNSDYAQAIEILRATA